MARKNRPELKFHEIIPDLLPEERAGRIEEFFGTLAAVGKETGTVKGYRGCRYHTDTEMLEIFVESAKEGG